MTAGHSKIKRLVGRQSPYAGYSRRNFVRASAVVNYQSIRCAVRVRRSVQTVTT